MNCLKRIKKEIINIESFYKYQDNKIDDDIDNQLNVISINNENEKFLDDENEKEKDEDLNINNEKEKKNDEKNNKNKDFEIKINEGKKKTIKMKIILIWK